MTPSYRIKNWAAYQHYRERRPPWVKLHRTLLDDAEFARIDASHARILVLLWLIASEHDGGALPDVPALAWRLRLPESAVVDAIASLGHWVEPVEQPASSLLAACEQGASKMLASRAPAHSRETETENQPTRACAGARCAPPPEPDRPTDRPTDQPTVIPPASEPPAEQPRAWSVDDYMSVALRNGANEREARKFAALNDAGRFSPDVAWRGWAAMRTPTEAAGGASGVARARGRAKAGDAVAGAKLASLRRLLEPGAPTLNFSRWLADAVSDVPAGARDRFVADARRTYQAVKPTEVQA